MKVYRVSNLERFRQFEQDEDADFERLIADLTGASEPSQAMMAGTAFHRVLEQATAGLELDEAEQDGFKFLFPRPLSVELAPIREVRASKTYNVDGVPVAVSGQLDQIDGKRIDDHKTTGRFDPDRYLEGFQWRLYLDIFGADRFRWNVFEIAETDGIAGSDAIVYEVKAAHRLEQYRYPQLGADCQRLVERFTRFAREYLE